MFKKLTIIIVCVLIAQANAVAGTLVRGSMLESSVKQPAHDGNHEMLGALATEETAEVDISGIPTGGDGVPPNDVTLTIDLGTGGLDTRVIGIGWDVNLDSFDPSWLSEATIEFNDGAFTLMPATGDDTPGLAMNYSSGGVVDITGTNGMYGVGDMSFVATGGMVGIRFFETFNDLAVNPDGMWLDGSTLVIEHVVVPEPAALGIAVFFLFGFLDMTRRK